MRTDIVKLSGDTTSALAKRIGYQTSRLWHGLCYLNGAELVAPDGSRMPVSGDMEVIFAERVEMEPRGSLCPVYKVTFTNGDTLEGFAPAWLKADA